MNLYIQICICFSVPPVNTNHSNGSANAPPAKNGTLLLNTHPPYLLLGKNSLDTSRPMKPMSSLPRKVPIVMHTRPHRVTSSTLFSAVEYSAVVWPYFLVSLGSENLHSPYKSLTGVPQIHIQCSMPLEKKVLIRYLVGPIVWILQIPMSDSCTPKQ